MAETAERSVAEVIRAHGGALPYRRLDELGIARARVGAARRAGEIVPVRTRWFATTDAPADVVRAVRVGGSLTGASVLRLAGIWMRRADPLLHVRVPQTAGRLWSPEPVRPGEVRARLDRSAHGVCVHYRTEPGLPQARDPLPLALAEYARCASRLDAHVAVDSALNLGELDDDGLADLRRRLGPALRPIVDLADRGCQSGTETIVRLLLRGRRVRHRTQVPIIGVGRVDVLVGDRLVIEIDGAGFHTGLEFEADRRRDFELVQRGYLVLRLSFSMVMQDWAEVRRGILALIERGEHRWGGRSRHHERSASLSLARRIRAE
ncbi:MULTISPECIES: endonuclease domain-containing protein [unclassified Agromyces]|uniref:endonuclease domain-containing protein n=1 Tax=unclassified Agromyces TaxID=2639701 RepID=UPI00301483B3